MIKFYVIFSLMCFLININGANLLLKRAHVDYDMGEFKFFEFLFSAYGMQFLILSFIPLVNLLMAIVFVFFADRAYKSVIDKTRDKVKK